MILSCVWMILVSTAGARAQKILFTGLTLHVGNGDSIPGAALLTDGSLIRYAGVESGLPKDISPDRTFTYNGAHAYPGFILPDNTLGLTEVDAVRATRDFYENTDVFSPELMAASAYNADSRIIPTVRRNGVLVTEVTPRGGIIAGTSGLTYLAGWTINEALVKQKAAIHLYWPERIRRNSAEEQRDDKKQDQLLRRQMELKDQVHRAAAYVLTPARLRRFNQKWEAMTGLFDGSVPLFLHARHDKDIIEAIMFFKSAGVKKIVLVCAPGNTGVIDFIAQEKVPVIIERIQELPGRDDEDIFMAYRFPRLLHEKGILFALAYSGGMEAAGSRNLPFSAGIACGHGLPYEQAVASISGNTARIFGVDDRLGTLEAGKEATFFISSGNALDMSTSNVVKIYIKGRETETAGDQEKQFEKYKTRNATIKD